MRVPVAIRWGENLQTLGDAEALRIEAAVLLPESSPCFCDSCHFRSELKIFGTKLRRQVVSGPSRLPGTGPGWTSLWTNFWANNGFILDSPAPLLGDQHSLFKSALKKRSEDSCSRLKVCVLPKFIR